MLFDARQAKMLLPGQHIVVDDCPGLRLEITASSKSWTYRYKSPVDGRMRQVKLGQWPAMPASSALLRWQEFRNKRTTGLDPALEKKQHRQEVAAGVYTVGNAVADYIAGHLNVNRKADGAKATAARLTKAVVNISEIPAVGVTRRVAFDLIAGLADKPVAARSVRNELGAAWDLALDAGKLSEDAPNWWRQIMAGKLRSKGAVRDGKNKGTAKRVLSELEISQLLKDDFALLSEIVQDVLTLYLWTATRGGEIVQMHTKQITHEPDGWWWTIPKELQKNSKRENAMDLRVPLLGRALEVVQRRQADKPKGYLFPSKSKEGYPAQAGIQSQVNFRQPYCVQRPDITRTRLSVTHWSPHDLRRTARTMLAGLGCPGDVAESILGHVQPGVSGIYNLHHYDQERRVWLQRWSDKLDTLTQAV
jgi:integrase